MLLFLCKTTKWTAYMKNKKNDRYVRSPYKSAGRTKSQVVICQWNSHATTMISFSNNYLYMKLSSVKL